ncbi:MAG: type I glyceraldehyde-3-phosphate dehydrogenase [Gammaproteobacteria bacterium]|nr:type I glyceraldehyde-3-phosphate dehydrogenase [Gammaproteobacteria bacterium]
MTIRIAINGYGRIGRNILRAHYEKKLHKNIQIVAINDLGDINTNVHLTRHDTTHGKFPGDVSLSGHDMIVNGDKIRVVAERDPKKLPWKELNIDIVFECTGFFTTKEKAAAHLEAGAKKVIISAPATGVDATIVFGVNDNVLKADDTVISNASCTTNCLATLVKPLHEVIGINSGLMNTVHAFTNDQSLLDVSHSDLRRSRSATQSIIPTKTGAASALGLVLPELNGKLDGFAVRVPTINVSLVDLTFEAKRTTTVEEINDVVRKAANGPMKGILAFNDEQLVSIDFNHHSASAIFDVFGTKVIGNLVKVLAWYDNEWGFSNRMLDVAAAWMEVAARGNQQKIA